MKKETAAGRKNPRLPAEKKLATNSDTPRLGKADEDRGTGRKLWTDGPLR